MTIMWKEKVGITKSILHTTAVYADITKKTKPTAYMLTIKIGFIENFGHRKNHFSPV